MTIRANILKGFLFSLLALSCQLIIANAAPAEVVPRPSLELTPAMQRFLADREISGRLPPLERMQRILDGLYGSEQGFTYASQETLTASEAFDQKRGNCVSFALLFVALAREAGLDARFNQIQYSPVWEEVGGVLVETCHVNAIVYVAGSQYVIEGVPEYEEVSARSRNPVSDERVFSHYYNNRALLAIARGDREAAQSLADAAIELDPSNATAWQNLGLLRFRQGDLVGGEEALLEASRLSSESSSVCFLLSQYYEKTGDSDQARRFADLGASRSKKNPFFHYYQSRQALAQGDLKKAIKCLDKALRLLPQYSKFQIELARLKRGEGREGSLVKHSAKDASTTIQ